jgi:hypothetical protein
MERKPNGDAEASLDSTGIKARSMNLGFYALYYADSEPSSATTATNAPAAAYAAAPAAAATVEPEETN